jgi:hypothetical protein
MYYTRYFKGVSIRKKNPRTAIGKGQALLKLLRPVF